MTPTNESLQPSAPIPANILEVVDLGQAAQETVKTGMARETAVLLGKVITELVFRESNVSQSTEPSTSDLVTAAGRLAEGLEVEGLIIDSFIKIFVENQTQIADGAALRELRQRRGLTQGEFAELLGTSRFQVNRIENGHVSIGYSLRQAINNLNDEVAT